MKSLFSAVFFPLLISTFFSVVTTSNIDENGPFRMRKVNLLWQKAKRMELSEETLNELYVELERQDRDERKWKHQRTEGKDKFGEMEAILRRNLLNIMDKYGLTGRKDSSGTPEEIGDHIATNRVHRGSFVKDERLEKLWDHAVNEEKFSKEELEELRQELTHHHEKWKQYQDLVALISEHEDRKSNIVGNNIPHDEETISKLREEMNMKQQKVNNNYRRLKVKVLRGISDNDFKDPRVRDLWKRAKAQGLSQEELELMKEELRHFDNRIAKHDDLEEQLDVAEDLLSQGHKHIKAKHEKLSAKVRENKKYIKKLHATLDKKIGPHNEL